MNSAPQRLIDPVMTRLPPCLVVVGQREHDLLELIQQQRPVLRWRVTAFRLPSR